MIEDIGLKYLVLQEALEEISGQEPENVGSVFAKCRYCGVSAPLNKRNSIKHKDNCPAVIAFRALSKVRKSIDTSTEQE